MTGPPLKSLIESLFEVVPFRSTHEELTFICATPGCGDQTGNRSVNLRTGKTYCFRCNTGGDFVVWARWLGFSIDDTGRAAGSTAQEIADLINRPAQSTLMPTAATIDMPEGFTLFEDAPDSVYTRMAAKLAERKNLHLEDFMAAGAGFTLRDDRWEPYCIFPVIEAGRTVYYQGRSYDDELVEGKTKCFPSRQEAPLGSRNWVYNIDALKEKAAKVAVVVESILNVLSLQRRLAELGWRDFVPICVFKHAVSRVQHWKITRYRHLTEFCFLYDFDAIAAAWRACDGVDDLLRVTVAEMPDLGNAKLDPNDNVDAAVDAIRDRRPFAPNGKVERRIQSCVQRYYALDLREVRIKSGSTQS